MSGCDAVVIGGGLTGCATAYYLARGGARVTLVEKGELNRGASGQNAGSLHFQLEFRMIEHGRRMAAQYALAIPVNLDSIATWGTVEHELGADLEVHQGGGLMVAETPAELESLRKKHALEQEAGMEAELITGDQARALEPLLGRSVRGAEYMPSEGGANPRLAAPAFAASAARLGADIRTHARVVGLRRDAGHWRVWLADGEELAAETVVVASGVWSAQLLAMADVRLPLVPVALSMVVTQRTGPSVTHLIQHAGRRLSLKQARDGNVLIGGGWPSRLVQEGGQIDLDAAPRPLWDSISGSASTAAHVVPAVQSLDVLRVWTGITALTVDGIPLVGAVPRRPGLFLIAAPGFVRAPTLGREMSQLILHGKTGLPLDAYSPGRLAHLNFI